MVDFDKYKNEYDKQFNNDFSIEECLIKERQKIVSKAKENYSHSKILEIGCGKNPFLTLFKDFNHYDIVEPVSSYLNKAKAISLNDKRFNFYNGKVEEDSILNQLAKNKYDFIIVSSLLHEVPDPVSLLSTIKTISNKNTIIHFNIPNVFSFHRLLATKAGIIDNIFTMSETEKRFQRKSRYDMTNFRIILNDNGYQIIEEGTYFLKPFTSTQLEEIYNKKIIGENVIRALSDMIEYIPDMGAEMYANVKIND
jgi:ubiquinone/menaquinone biosynthesis C-methylase UbiE